MPEKIKKDGNLPTTAQEYYASKIVEYGDKANEASKDVDAHRAFATWYAAIATFTGIAATMPIVSFGLVVGIAIETMLVALSTVSAGVTVYQSIKSFKAVSQETAMRSLVERAKEKRDVTQIREAARHTQN